MLHESVFQMAQTAYRAWGLPAEHLNPESVTSPESFRSMLSDIAPRIPAIPCRVVPSSFSPDEATLSAVPRPLLRRWSSCTESLRAFNSVGVMMRLPLFYQMEQLLYLACEDAHAFIFINDQANMPLGAAALDRGEIDTVLATRDDAAAFYAFCVGNKSKTPRLWILIEDISTVTLALPDVLHDQTVTREIHLFPGVPVLVQCLQQARVRNSVFHVADAYQIELDDKNRALLSSTSEEPFPFFKYVLPIGLHEHTTCSCGKPAYTIAD